MKRILIIDDDAIVRKILRKIINKNDPKLVVFEAVDSFEAGEKLAFLTPSVVVQMSR